MENLRSSTRDACSTSTQAEEGNAGASLLIDQFGRRIDYLRVSVTDRCNLRCAYCCPHGSFRPIPRSELLSFERIRQFIEAAAALGIGKIRLTGGEPLARRDLPRLVSMIASVPGIRETCLTTNGTLLAHYARALRDAGLRRVNVSLDTLRPDRYRLLTRGGSIEAVLSGLRAAREAGLLPVKINFVRQPVVNDRELPALEKFCLREGYSLQIIDRMDLTSERHGIARDPSSMRPPPCSACNKLRLTCDGKLYPCLFSSAYIDIGACDDDQDAILRAVGGKKASGRSFPHETMARIGG